MLNVTEDAAKVLTVMLESNEVEEGNCLRLTVKGESEFGFEVAATGSAGGDEQSIECEGREVLIVSADASSRLDGLTLDVQQSPEGRISLALMGPAEESEE